MKGMFFIGVLVLIPVIVLGGGFVYLVWRSIYSLYDDWQLGKELEEIREVSRARREERNESEHVDSLRDPSSSRPPDEGGAS